MNYFSTGKEMTVLDIVISIAKLERNVKYVFENKLSKEDRIKLLSNSEYKSLIELHNCILTEEEINFINLNDL